MSTSSLVSISCASLRGADPVRYAVGQQQIDICLDMTPRQMYEAVQNIRLHVSAETWHAWTLRIAEECAA